MGWLGCTHTHIAHCYTCSARRSEVNYRNDTPAGQNLPLLCFCWRSSCCLSEWLLGGALGDDSGLTELRLEEDKALINRFIPEKRGGVCMYQQNHIHTCCANLVLLHTTLTWLSDFLYCNNIGSLTKCLWKFVSKKLIKTVTLNTCPAEALSVVSVVIENKDNHQNHIFHKQHISGKCLFEN